MGYSTCATHYLMRGLHGYLPLSVTASPTPENLAELTLIIAVEKPAWTFTDFKLHSLFRNVFCRREIQIWQFGQKDSPRPAPSHKKKSLPAQWDTAPRVHKQNSQRFLRRFPAGSSFFAASSAVTGGSQRKLARKCQHRFHQYAHLNYIESSMLWLLSYLYRKP